MAGLPPVHVNDSEVVVRQPAKQALHAVCAWLVRQSERTALRALMERPAYQVDKRMEFDEFSREFSAMASPPPTCVCLRLGCWGGLNWGPESP